MYKYMCMHMYMYMYMPVQIEWKQNEIATFLTPTAHMSRFSVTIPRNPTGPTCTCTCMCTDNAYNRAETVLTLVAHFLVPHDYSNHFYIQCTHVHVGCSGYQHC